MAAVRKTGLKAYVRQVEIGEQQKVLGLAHAHKLDVFLAAAPVHLPKILRKIRVAHSAAVRQSLHGERFGGVLVDVLGDTFNARTVADARGAGGVEAFLAPAAGEGHHELAEVGMNHEIIAETAVVKLVHAGVEDAGEKSPVESLRREKQRSLRRAAGRLGNRAEARRKAAGSVEAGDVEFDDAVTIIFRVRWRHGVNHLRMEDGAIPRVKDGLFVVALRIEFADFHVDDLYVVVPVRARRIVYVVRLHPERFVGGL